MKAITLDELNEDICKTETVAELIQKQNIDSFESLCNSILNDEIIVIAGRPGIGKTSLLLNMLVNQVVNKDEKVLLVATNDNRKTNLIKLINLLQTRENLKSSNYNNILLNPEKIQSPYKAKDFISKTLKENEIKAVYIDDICELSWINEMYFSREEYENLSDYSESSTFNSGIGEFFSFLKFISLHHNIPIFITEGISRNAEIRPSKEPMLSDLRSEKLEVLADKILLLHRLNYYGFTEDEEGRDLEGITDVIIAKNKSGTGKKIVRLKLNSNSLYI